MFRFYIEKINYFIYTTSARQRKMARNSSQALHDIIVKLGMLALNFYDMENPKGINGLRYFLIEPNDKCCSMYIAVLNGEPSKEFVQNISDIINWHGQRGRSVNISDYRCSIDESTLTLRKFDLKEQLALSERCYNE
jgi:hypothetical protein